VAVEGLAIYVPAGRERAAALRLLCLTPRPRASNCSRMAKRISWWRVDPRDHGNLDTRLEPCRRPAPNLVEAVGAHYFPSRSGAGGQHDGRVSLRVRGHRVRRTSGRRVAVRAGGTASGARAFTSVNRAPGGGTRPGPLGGSRKIAGIPLYRQIAGSLAGIAGRARRSRRWTQRSCATPSTTRCRPSPGASGGHPGPAGRRPRGPPDGGGTEKHRRTCNLPYRPLDYWIRVNGTWTGGEFTAHGYFPGLSVAAGAAEAAGWFRRRWSLSPSTESILGYFAAGIEVERVGLAADWRKGFTGDVPPARRGAARSISGDRLRNPQMPGAEEFWGACLPMKLEALSLKLCRVFGRCRVVFSRSMTGQKILRYVLVLFGSSSLPGFFL